MKINYVAALRDASGYAEAARNNVAALLLYPEIDLGCHTVSFENFKSNLGSFDTLLSSLEKKKHQHPDIQIVHLTPQNFPKLRHLLAYNIGYSTWETNQLPYGWADMINAMDECWVPSAHNVNMFLNSGVRIPVYKFPHTFDMKKYHDSCISTLPLGNLNDDTFVFYSIFQWLERKNPIDLVISYLTEFKKEENVCLILKTYLRNPEDNTESQLINRYITEIKQRLWLDNYPRILLITSLLSSEQIYALHQRGNCFVSLNRCEGFGIPIAEAMLYGKPVITTGYGGPVDFIKHKETGFLVDYRMRPCSGMPWNIYTGDMQWADPSILDARKHMRWVFDNQDQAQKIGCLASQTLSKEFSYQEVGLSMLKRLKTIH